MSYHEESMNGSVHSILMCKTMEHAYNLTRNPVSCLDTGNSPAHFSQSGEYDQRSHFQALQDLEP